MNNIEIYRSPNGNTEISVRLEEETVWLTQNQLVELFDSSKANISEHIKHIYEEGELDELSTVRKFRTVQYEGKRSVSREQVHYNLDLIISLGYRVKSATSFRKWATNILRQYLVEGYAINQKRLEQEHKKFLALQTMPASLAKTLNSEKLEKIEDVKKAINFLYPTLEEKAAITGQLKTEN